MGRILGFLGGTILTSSIAYLSLEHFRQHRTYISQSLRSSRKLSDSLLAPAQVPRLPEPRIERPSLVETLKDAWNWEVESMVRWVQGWDLIKARERFEETAINIVGSVKK
ncbi:uncharacterized protein LAJ45_03209 [Morchella importuna]|uniref:MICOS complex subunit MIC12 n=1 Tax=Morchella conica CCBAS932 TaxID=1392247 RepID=A0A3N4KTV5_9PEZI|nr:uncharacterized protein LAJ45_03209 [Morchella importuna]KAH8152982.1 hypothetical protein LAJ45_03209 [Morchella importuna]RPB12918.1 hypothetical protein P167DRAFT_505668 [Morchella conica CCBAS932]